MQTRIGSITESLANVAVGFTINLIGNLLILPMFGFDVTVAAAFGIGLWFTAISIARSYILRRFFNGLRFGRTPELAGMEHAP